MDTPSMQCFRRRRELAARSKVERSELLSEIVTVVKEAAALVFMVACVVGLMFINPQGF
ncbi:hypothetical protein [Endozoicomonas sp. ALC066]|uniref:hypothetical protein n=1 Tax=Endozoicomonas sp. ALC066 TaxID=3403078 RepID=UPI003BB534E5